ncbi:MAG: phosphatidylserine decarboxylase [Chitinophagales bacterium]|nr:phosphatidylserine decarboxylase [Chitinophagales bacterium]
MGMVRKIILGIVVLLCVLLIGGLAYYQFYFLRLPARNIPHQANLFVSPANGRVASVTHWNADSLVITKGNWGAIKVLAEDVGQSGTLVAITLNLANVHFQRAPIKGTYLGSTYKKGAFKNALKHENQYGLRFENEHNQYLFKTQKGSIYKVVQIAGFAARRIVDYIQGQPNTPVEQGKVIGLMKLGSQVAVLLPENAEVLVKKGDILIDGETPLAIEK